MGQPVICHQGRYRPECLDLMHRARGIRVITAQQGWHQKRPLGARPDQFHRLGVARQPHGFRFEFRQFF